MRTRAIWLAALTIAALLISACAAAAPAGLKIGLVTDVGTLDDKNFNQYSWEGAQDGATGHRWHVERRGDPPPPTSRRTSSRSSTRSTTSS